MDEIDDWSRAVCRALDINDVPPVDSILLVARDAAHAVARPAAPVTTYLLGIAVAQGSDLDTAVAKLTELAESWPQTRDI